MSLIRPGDWLFLQFAHNDQKMNAEHTDAATPTNDRATSRSAASAAGGPAPTPAATVRRLSATAAAAAYADNASECPEQGTRRRQLHKETPAALLHFVTALKTC